MGKMIIKTELNVWRPIPLGAGGFITGGDIVDDIMVCRTDTYGAYYYNRALAKWVQLMTQSSMPSGDWYIDGYDYGNNCWEIRIAPSNTNIFYMSVNGYLYRSINKGQNWIRTNFPQLDRSLHDGNGQWKLIGSKFAIDPNDPNKLIMGHSDGQVRRSSDGGNTWTVISDITTATSNGPASVLYVSSSVVYVSNYGRRVWQSIDGGVTFTQLSGGPTQITNWTKNSAGDILACAYPVSGNNFYKLRAGIWANITNVSGARQAVVVNPSDDAHIITFGDGTTPSDQSFNGGSNWTGPYYRNYPRVPTVELESSATIPWQETWFDNDTNGYMSCGNVIWSAYDNKIYDFEGIGVQRCTHPTTYDTNISSLLTWEDFSVGIEQLVVNKIDTIPGIAGVFVACWDRPFYHITDLYSYATEYFPYYSPLTHCWDFGSAKDNRNVIAANINFAGGQPAYSLDGGLHWTTFVAPTANLGGAIAVSTALNWIFMPGSGDGPWYTPDGAGSWTRVGNVPTTGWSFSPYLYKHNVSADEVTLNKFYMYDYATGVWVTSNGGVSSVNTVGPFPTSGFNSQIVAVPGHADYVLFTSGPIGAPSAANPGDQLAYRSTNGAVSFSAIPNLKEITRFGFGKQIGAGYDVTFFAVGWYDDGGGYDYGFWYSTDNMATWILIDNNAGDSFDIVTSISGDMNVAKRVYIGFRGSGGMWMDFS